MDTAARVWVCVEKDAWQAALLLHRAKDSAEVILEEDGWAMDSGPSSPRRRKGREREGMLDSKQSTVISLATSALVLRNPAHLEGSDDLVKLQFLDEPNIIHNLSLRYSAGKIYTSTGPILIAVNPWRNLDIYSAGVMDMYKGQASGQLPPHVFGVADSAYRAMLREQRNQSILVSGESGAGKTESTKFIMSFLAYVSASSGGGASSSQWPSTPLAKPQDSLATKVLDSNPLLEAFGNAKTLRNDNSSRFGKYIDLHFGGNGALLGGSIQTYLLEKARVVQQASGERNFHIFHELVEGCRVLGEELQARVKISPSSTYHYLSSHSPSAPSHSPSLRSVRSPLMASYPGAPSDFPSSAGADACMLQTTLKALGAVAGEEVMSSVVCAVAAVLHLGDVEIGDASVAGGGRDQASFCVASQSYDAACSLLGVECQELEASLCRRSIVATSEDRYDLTVSQEQAVYTRDALAKAVYTRLFSRLVRIINESLKGSRQDKLGAAPQMCVSVLDIFGFEFFVENRFEQFCINYANEKLQQFFVDFVFKLEQSQYIEEGIEWENVMFKDNASCLATIEGKQGVLSVLDEICILPQGTDERFSAKVRAEMEGKPHFETPNFPRGAFCIQHYAGDVVYSTEKFVDSNRDFLQPAIIDLMTKCSSCAFLRELFEGDASMSAESMGNSKLPSISKQRLDSSVGPAGVGGGTRHRSSRSTLLFASVTTQFRRQLTSLVQEISKTSPHFVRCINPNKTKTAGACSASAILEQLRCGGVMDAVHVTRSGFGSRYPYEDFCKRYSCCAPLASSVSNLRDRSVQVLRLIGLDGSLYRLGRTKMFLRHNVIEILETRRSEILTTYILCIQCAWKQHKCRLDLRQRREELERLRESASLTLTSHALAAARRMTWRVTVSGAVSLQAVVRRLLESSKAPAGTSLKAESPGGGSSTSTHGHPMEREGVSHEADSSVPSTPQRAARQHAREKGGSPAGRLTIVGAPSSVVPPSSSSPTGRDLEGELEEEREMREALVQAVEESMRDESVTGLKSLLEQLSARQREGSRSNQVRNLELCSRLVQSKLDMSARLESVSASRTIQKPEPGEAESHLMARVKALEGELQQACEREAQLHRDLCLARPSDRGGPEESLRSMSAQNMQAVKDVVAEVQARRELGRFVNRVLDCSAWDAPGREEGLCEELIRESAAGSALEVKTRGGRGGDTLDACARLLSRRPIKAESTPGIKDVIEAAGSKAGQDWELAMQGSIDALRAEADEAAQERDLERAARIQLSSFVRDISSVGDAAFLRARLDALRSKVRDEKLLLAGKIEMAEESQQQQQQSEGAHDGAHNLQGGGVGAAELPGVGAAGGALLTSGNLIRDMQVCASLIEDKVRLLDRSSFLEETVRMLDGGGAGTGGGRRAAAPSPRDAVQMLGRASSSSPSMYGSPRASIKSAGSGSTPRVAGSTGTGARGTPSTAPSPGRVVRGKTQG